MLVFVRVTGMFTFNPIFGRQNVPMQVRAAMSLALAVCMLAGFGGTTGYIPASIPGFVFVLISEALIGYVFGLFTNLILTVLILGGEIMDNQMGLSMANVMDPGSGIRMPIFANFNYYLFIFYFFLAGIHLEYIRLFYLSYDIIPVGFSFTLNTQTTLIKVVMFLGTIFELSIKLALPIIAAEFISTVCVGVIMKAVPNIQIFIFNVQLKIAIGILMVLILAKPLSDFVEGLLSIYMQNLNSLLYHFI